MHAWTFGHGIWQRYTARGPFRFEGLHRHCRSQTTFSPLISKARPSTYLLTPWSRVLEKLVKKFSAFYGTRKFLTALTSSRHVSLSWASPIQLSYPHPTSWRYILTFPPIYALVSPAVSFPQVSHQNPVHASLLPHTCHMSRQSQSSRFYYPHDHSALHYVIFSIPLYLAPLRTKYSPQYPILKHPQ
jgi:hypothetical protein